MDYFRYFLALLVVLGLIGLLSIFLRRYGMGAANLLANFQKIKQGNLNKSASRTLRLKESLFLDPRHRLVLVECNGKDHLLLLGANGDLELGRPACEQTPSVNKTVDSVKKGI